MKVSAALCFSGGRIWIFRRGPGRKNAGLWEFPGGKEEPGETPAQCLLRELREELRLPVTPPQPAAMRVWEGIRFTFLRCQALGEPTLSEHTAQALVPPRELLHYAFCPADAPIARALALGDPPLRNFFWDLDGTVLDTYPGMTVAFCRACAPLGLTPRPEDVLALMKDSLGRCAAHYAQAAGVETAALLSAFRREEAQLPPPRPLPGIPEALSALSQRGARHFLATHRHGESRSYLAACGLLSAFDDLVTGDDPFPRKPAPDGLRHLLGRHGLAADESVMIGDRPLDVEAGRNAGMLGCLLDRDGRFADFPCALRLRYPGEIPGYFRPLEGKEDTPCESF